MRRLSSRSKIIFLVLLVILSCVGCKSEDEDIYTKREWSSDLMAMTNIEDLDAWGIKIEGELDEALLLDDVAGSLAPLLDQKELVNIPKDIERSKDPSALALVMAHGIIDQKDEIEPQKTVDRDEAKIYLSRLRAIIDHKEFEDEAFVEYQRPITIDESPSLDLDMYEAGEFIYSEADDKFYEITKENGIKDKREISFEDVFEKVDIQGTIEDLDLSSAEIEIDGEIIEDDSIYAQDGIERMANFSPSGEFEKGGFKISYAISLNKIHLHVSKKTDRGINVYFDGDIYGIKPSYKWDYEDGTIKEAYLKVDFKTSEEVGMSIGRYKFLYGDFSLLEEPKDLFNKLKDFMKPKEDIIDTSFTLMKIKLPIANFPLASFDIELKLNIYVSGKVEIAIATDHTVGAEINNGAVRLILDHQEDIDFNIDATASSTLSLSFALSLLKDLVDVRFNGGIKANVGTTLHMYDSEGHLISTSAKADYDVLEASADKDGVYVCADLSLSWILNIELNSEKTLASMFGLSKKFTILDEDDQVLGNKSHIEKGQFVDHCTYKDRASKTSMPTVSIKSERISLGSYAMVIRGPSKIDIVALPSGYSRSDLRYESEDEAIVSLDADGSITPLSNGVTKVRVYTADEKHEAYINILVSIDEKEA